MKITEEMIKLFLTEDENKEFLSEVISKEIQKTAKQEVQASFQKSEEGTRYQEAKQEGFARTIIRDNVHNEIEPLLSIDNYPVDVEKTKKKIQAQVDKDIDDAVNKMIQKRKAMF